MADEYTASRRLNRALLVAPVICSMIALALVLGNVAAGVPHQADEGTAAHVFQVMIVVQLPLVISFIATADWKQTLRLALALAAHALAAAAALGPLAWAAY